MKENDVNRELVESLAFLMASEKLSPRDVLPALEILSKEQPGLNRILALLDEQEGQAFNSLKSSLQQSRKEDADKFFQQNSQGRARQEDFVKSLDGFPLKLRSGWEEISNFSRLEVFCNVFNDYLFLSGREKSVPGISALVLDEFRMASDALRKSASIWAGVPVLKLIDGFWDEVDDETQLLLREFKPEIIQSLKKEEELAVEKVKTLPVNLEVENHDAFLMALNKYDLEKAENLERFTDLIINWPLRDICPLFIKLLKIDALKERLEILLTMRFGKLKSGSWEDFLAAEEEVERARFLLLKPLMKKHALALFYNWCLEREDVSESLLSALKKACAEKAQSVSAQSFVSSREGQISQKEANVLLGVVEEPVKAPVKEKVPEKAPAVDLGRLAEKVSKSRAAAEPEPAKTPVEEKEPEPKKPSIWEEHMKPFLSDNWFMLAGVILFVVGSAILSYVTWDKHWLFRYTLMPALLASFTVGLAFLGRWIEEKDKEFIGTSTILRAAAVQLLPINFMAVALMSSDDVVSLKHIVVPLMATVYLVLSWIGLKRWCAAVSEKMAVPLGRTVLLINSLVVLAPLANAFGLNDEKVLLLILGLGFYLGFGILALSVIHFSKNILSAEMASEKRVIWFFAIASAGTYIQVFGWVHSHIRYLPHIHTYAPMLIMAAALLLMLERRAIELLGKNKSTEAESFLGYALIVFAVFMGAGHEYIRIICCLLAGAAWYLQAKQRKEQVHYYISVNLIIAAVFCLGFTSFFPKALIPLLGVLCAAGLSVLVKISRRKRNFVLAQVCKGTELAVLLIIVLSAVIIQLSTGSQPYLTALYLIFSAAMFLKRAYLDDQLRWVHSAMFIFALTLPYLGCVDLKAGTLEGNTLIFGLSILSLIWILASRFIPFKLLKEARSTVLWFYGILSVTAMIIRVILERGAAVDPLWYMAFMDYAGPLMMSGILVFAAYFSRSLIPAVMASVIAIILFPELKANFRATFEMVGFGSGLGSALSSLVIILISFYLRRHPRLKNLGEGDRFLEKHYFPLRRYDHTLFTWPLMASACFLLLKTGTFNVVRQMAHGGISVKGSCALIVLGLSSWLLCIYFRKGKGNVCFHPGWIYTGLGIHLLYARFVDHGHWSKPVFFTLLVLQLLHFLSSHFSARFEWLQKTFVKPSASTLACLSHLTGFLCLLSFIIDGGIKKHAVLMVFLAGQFIWHGLRSKNRSFAVHLYILVWTVLVPWQSATPSKMVFPSAFLALSVFIVHIFFERKSSLYNKLKPLLQPCLLMATVSAAALGHLAFPLLDSFYGLSKMQVLLTASVLLLSARAHVSRFLLLWSLCIFYGLLHYESIENLLNPWHLSCFSLALALLNHSLIPLNNKFPKLVRALRGIKFLRSTDPAWIFLPAVFLCGFSEIWHLSSAFRDSAVQISSSFLAAAALSVTAWSWRKTAFYNAAILFLTLGNIHIIRVLPGEWLKNGGLSESHLICLGLGLSLLITGSIRKFIKESSLKVLLTHASLLMSMAVLVVLVANYMIHPNLESISLLRFAVSGAMSLLAALYFRNSARHPQPGYEENKDICEGIYHFGLCITFWCTALMVPVLRSPQTAMLAFGIPAVYLYLRAEICFRNQAAEFKQYRNSATVMFFVLLGLYVCRTFVHMIFYPEAGLDSSYYHTNAPLITVFGILLFRLHALGGSEKLAFYGGLAIVTGVFFTVTWPSGLSPFKEPLRAGWAAVIMAHFWILLNHKRSPLRTYFQKFACLSDEQWTALRIPWGVCLLAASQLMVFTGMLQAQHKPLLLAPLLSGAATVAFHLYAVRKNVLYVLIGGLEFLLALHAGFFIESYLPAEKVVWALLGIWALLPVLHACRPEKIPAAVFGKAVIGLSILVTAHVLFHGAASGVGIASVLLMALLALLTPQGKLHLKSEESKIISILYIILPSYLSYFTVFDRSELLSKTLQAAPVPACIFTLFCTALSIHFLKIYTKGAAIEIPGLERRLLNLVLEWIQMEAVTVYRVLLYCCTAGSLVSIFIFREQAFINRDFGMLLFLTGGLAAAWFRHGKEFKSMSSSVLMIASGLMFLALVRHQTVMLSDFWKNEYDIWLCILISLFITSSKQWVEQSERYMKMPVLCLLFLVPAAALAWSAYHGLGTNYTLAIIGMNSLLFTFLGKDNRQSPYNLLAVSGYVAFTIIALWSKLEIHSFHVHVIPTGMGVLILLQLFHDKLSAESRREIRFITLTAMVSTAAYYALVAEPRSIGFNLTMISLCLVSMAFGSLLKIRLYLSFGFAGLSVNLISILVRVVADMNKGARIAIMGGLILAIGGILVFGNLYYKTHQEKIRHFIDKWKDRLKLWE